MDELCDSIECLCNSPLRLQILDALSDTRMDVRDLMAVLDSPRSSVQRNLSVLQERGWVESVTSGYAITTVGRIQSEVFEKANKTVESIGQMAPFFEVVNEITEIDISRLNDVLVTIPESTHPNAPMNRLRSIFTGVNHVRGFLPSVSSYSVEFSRRGNGMNVPDLEYLLSSDAFVGLCQEYASEDADGADLTPPEHIDLRIYDGDLPYGLFVSEDTLALAGYNEVGRIQAVVESTSEETIDWAERVYKKYRRDSKRLHEVDISSLAHVSNQ